MHSDLQVAAMGQLLHAHAALPGATNAASASNSNKARRVVHAAGSFGCDAPSVNIALEVAQLPDATAKKHAIEAYLWGGGEGGVCGAGEARFLQMATSSQTLPACVRRIVAAALSIETSLVVTGRVVYTGLSEEVFKMGLCFVALRSLGYSRSLDVFCACCCSAMAVQGQSGLHKFLAGCTANTSSNNQMASGSAEAAATAFSFSPHLRVEAVLKSKAHFAAAAGLVALTDTELYYLQLPSVIAGFSAVPPASASLDRALTQYRSELQSLAELGNVQRGHAAAAAASESAALKALQQEVSKEKGMLKALQQEIAKEEGIITALAAEKKKLAKSCRRLAAEKKTLARSCKRQRKEVKALQQEVAKEQGIIKTLAAEKKTLAGSCKRQRKEGTSMTTQNKKTKKKNKKVKVVPVAPFRAATAAGKSSYLENTKRMGK